MTGVQTCALPISRHEGGRVPDFHGPGGEVGWNSARNPPRPPPPVCHPLHRERGGHPNCFTLAGPQGWWRAGDEGLRTPPQPALQGDGPESQLRCDSTSSAAPTKRRSKTDEPASQLAKVIGSKVKGARQTPGTPPPFSGEQAGYRNNPPPHQAHPGSSFQRRRLTVVHSLRDELIHGGFQDHLVPDGIR